MSRHPAALSNARAGVRARGAALVRLGTIAFLLLSTANTASAAPKEKGRKTSDLIWTLPGLDTLGIQAIAVLPAASYTHDRQNERMVEGLFAQAMRSAGYRWISPQVTRELIRSPLGDSTLAAIDKDLLALGRVDSLRARVLCRAVRAGALLGLRVDQFEKVEVEWNQSGKPTTTVRLRGALVDSTGRLLWSASGSETGEGTFHDPEAATLGIKATTGNTPVTGQAGAPSFQDVTTRLFARWAAAFPARRAPEPPPAQP